MNDELFFQICRGCAFLYIAGFWVLLVILIVYVWEKEPTHGETSDE